MSTRVPRALLPSELPEVWVSLRCCVAKVPREETRGRRESGSDCLAFEWAGGRRLSGEVRSTCAGNTFVSVF